jgi:hypothetical protein
MGGGGGWSRRIKADITGEGGEQGKNKQKRRKNEKE